MFNKSLIIALSTLALVACGGSGGGGSKSQSNQFSSPYDPCLVEGSCTNKQRISYDELLEIYRNQSGSFNLEIGSQTTSDVIATETGYSYNDETQEWEQVQCDVKYTMKRTLVSFDDETQLVHETKDNFVFKPDNEACRDLIQWDQEYQSPLMAKEDKINYELAENPTEEQRQFLNQMRFYKLNYMGVASLRVEGLFEGEAQVSDSDGNFYNYKFKVGIMEMLELIPNLFIHEIFNTNKTFPNDYLPKGDESATTRTSIATVDPDTLDQSGPVVDRRYQDDDEDKKNSFFNIMKK